MFCRFCGAELDKDTKTCPKCGSSVGEGSNGFYNPDGSIGRIVNGKNKFAAALFSLFFGTFGIHYFYLGNTLYGVLCILFFWTGIPAILGVVTAIMILTESDEDFAKRIVNN